MLNHSEHKCVKRKERKIEGQSPYLPISKPDSESIFPAQIQQTLSPCISVSLCLCLLGVSSEGSCGRRPSAGHQYSSRLCLLWCGQQNNFILILQINSCTQQKATSPAWLAEPLRCSELHYTCSRWLLQDILVYNAR